MIGCNLFSASLPSVHFIYYILLFISLLLRPNLYTLVTLYILDLLLSLLPCTRIQKKNNTALVLVCVKLLVTLVKALDFTLYHSIYLIQIWLIPSYTVQAPAALVTLIDNPFCLTGGCVFGVCVRLDR